MLNQFRCSNIKFHLFYTVIIISGNKRHYEINLNCDSSDRQVPEKGNWTKAHFSPYKFSGSSIGKGLSSARSGFDPF